MDESRFPEFRVTIRWRSGRTSTVGRTGFAVRASLRGPLLATGSVVVGGEAQFFRQPRLGLSLLDAIDGGVKTDGIAPRVLFGKVAPDPSPYIYAQAFALVPLQISDAELVATQMPVWEPLREQARICRQRRGVHVVEGGRAGGHTMTRC